MYQYRRIDYGNSLNVFLKVSCTTLFIFVFSLSLIFHFFWVFTLLTYLPDRTLLIDVPFLTLWHFLKGTNLTALWQQLPKQTQTYIIQVRFVCSLRGLMDQKKVSISTTILHVLSPWVSMTCKKDEYNLRCRSLIMYLTSPFSNRRICLMPSPLLYSVSPSFSPSCCLREVVLVRGLRSKTTVFQVHKIVFT